MTLISDFLVGLTGFGDPSITTWAGYFSFTCLWQRPFGEHLTHSNLLLSDSFWSVTSSRCIPVPMLWWRTASTVSICVRFLCVVWNCVLKANEESKVLVSLSFQALMIVLSSTWTVGQNQGIKAAARDSLPTTMLGDSTGPATRAECPLQHLSLSNFPIANTPASLGRTFLFIPAVLLCPELVVQVQSLATARQASLVFGVPQELSARWPLPTSKWPVHEAHGFCLCHSSVFLFLGDFLV